MTEEELAQIREWRDFANHVSDEGEMFMLSRGVAAIDKLLAEVERLRTENAALRQAVAALQQQLEAANDRIEDLSVVGRYEGSW